MSNPDFIALSKAAHPEHGDGPREALSALWIALYGLESWLIATAPGDLTQPLVYELDGKRWIFVFTDADKLAEFRKMNKLADDTFLSMSPDSARAWANDLSKHGLFGVHFNHGCPGWFSPIENLDLIHRHLFG